MEIEKYKLDNIKASKILIFDSSSIITLNMINMLNILTKLKEKFGGEFLIPNDVFNEVVKVPMGIKKYELRALFIKKAISNKIFRVIKDRRIDKETNNILEKANSLFEARREKIRIIHKGEASCIALWDLLEINKKGLVIDERTTRMLFERPSNLKRLLEIKLHTKIKMNENLAKKFSEKKIKIIRSTELLFIAFEKNQIGIANGKKQILDALLYGAKAYGCSISREEIEKLKRTI